MPREHRERHSKKSWDEVQSRDKKQMEMLRKFKAREERIVVGVTAITLALDKGDIINARKFMGEMMREDLNEAIGFVTNKDLALKVAIGALLLGASFDDDGSHFRERETALKHICVLSPELYDEAVADSKPKKTSGVSCAVLHTDGEGNPAPCPDKGRFS